MSKYVKASKIVFSQAQPRLLAGLGVIMNRHFFPFGECNYLVNNRLVFTKNLSFHMYIKTINTKYTYTCLCCCFFCLGGPQGQAREHHQNVSSFVQ